MKLLAKEDKNTRKCKKKKKKKKVDKLRFHRGHNDSHCSTMGRLSAQENQHVYLFYF
jgi:hypothetical protein